MQKLGDEMVVKKIQSVTGNILVGTSDFASWVNNGFIEGETKVYHFDDKQEFEEFQKHHKLTLQTIVRGEFCVYSKDICDRTEEDIALSLNGIYGVYSRCGKVAFSKIYNGG